MFESELHPRRKALAKGPRPPARQQDLLQPRTEGKRDIARAVGAARDRRVDLAQRDAVAELRERGEARAARALQVVGRRRRMQARAEHRLARQVPVLRMLDYRARGDLADLLVLQTELVDQRPEGRSQHVLI